MLGNISGWHVLILFVLTIPALVLFICAIVSIVRARLAAGAAALWVLVCLFFPLVGSILWFVVGRRSAARAD